MKKLSLILVLLLVFPVNLKVSAQTPDQTCFYHGSYEPIVDENEVGFGQYFPYSEWQGGDIQMYTDGSLKVLYGGFVFFIQPETETGYMMDLENVVAFAKFENTNFNSYLYVSQENPNAVIRQDGSTLIEYDEKVVDIDGTFVTQEGLLAGGVDSFRLITLTDSGTLRSYSVMPENGSLQIVEQRTERVGISEISYVDPETSNLFFNYLEDDGPYSTAHHTFIARTFNKHGEPSDDYYLWFSMAIVGETEVYDIDEIRLRFTGDSLNYVIANVLLENNRLHFSACGYEPQVNNAQYFLFG